MASSSLRAAVYPAISARGFASASNVARTLPGAASTAHRTSLSLNDKDLKTLAAAQRASFSSAFAKENASDRVSEQSRRLC